MLSNETVHVNSFVGNQDLLVFVDRLDAEHAALDEAALSRLDDQMARSAIEVIPPDVAAELPYLDLPANTSLRVFRRIIGDLVLYELTPMPEARVSPWFEQLQSVPRNWIPRPGATRPPDPGG